MKRIKALVVAIGVLVLMLSCCCCCGGDWRNWEDWEDWEDWGMRSLESAIVEAGVYGAATPLLVVGR
jgi:hypothetical protein